MFFRYLSYISRVNLFSRPFSKANFIPNWTRLSFNSWCSGHHQVVCVLKCCMALPTLWPLRIVYVVQQSGLIWLFETLKGTVDVSSRDLPKLRVVLCCTDCSRHWKYKTVQFRNCKTLQLLSANMLEKKVTLTAIKYAMSKHSARTLSSNEEK